MRELLHFHNSNYSTIFGHHLDIFLIKTHACPHTHTPMASYIMVLHWVLLYSTINTTIHILKVVLFIPLFRIHTHTPMASYIMVLQWVLLYSTINTTIHILKVVLFIPLLEYTHTPMASYIMVLQWVLLYSTIITTIHISR